MAVKMIVCGGRDYTNYIRVFEFLSHLVRWIYEGGYGYKNNTPVHLLIEGEATGADTLAAAWAIWKGMPLLRKPANWKKHKRAAGPIRNAEMLEVPGVNLVVAFPGGPGTADMVAKAKEKNVQVIEVTDKPFDWESAHSKRWFPYGGAYPKNVSL